LGKQALEEIAKAAKPDTILGWHRKLVDQKFDGSKQRKSLGRPRVDKELEDWVVKLAQENRSWGYDRIVGALAELGYDISDQTVGNILKRRGIPTAPERKKTTTWQEFIRSHMNMLWATDFFSTEVLTLGGLVAFYVLFFIKLDTREVHIAGITAHPNEQEEALSRFILFGEKSLRHVLTEYLAHYHVERPHQGKGNVILFPGPRPEGAAQGCHSRSSFARDRHSRCDHSEGDLV
jgi:transposase